MLSFKQSAGVFQIRVAGILLKADQVLLHRLKRDNFWSLPGGRCDHFESTSATLKREFVEELQVEIEVDRLVWVIESFFEYAQKKYHEIGFYYLVSSEQDPLPSNPYETVENGREYVFQWFGLDQLNALEVEPVFLKTELKEIPRKINHLFINDLGSNRQTTAS